MSKITITSGKILKGNTIIEVEYEKAREDAKPAESSALATDVKNKADALAAAVAANTPASTETSPQG